MLLDIIRSASESAKLTVVRQIRPVVVAEHAATTAHCLLLSAFPLRTVHGVLCCFFINTRQSFKSVHLLQNASTH